MHAHFLFDVLYLSSDLISGKSIPVLVGITRLPTDQFLAGIVLSMGAVTGVFYSVYAVRATDPRATLVFYNTLVHSCFALFFTLSTLLSVSRGVHYERGIILSLIPAFCVVSQPLPLRESTYLISFLLVAFLFPYCMSVPAPASDAPELLPAFQLPSVLQNLNPSDASSTEAESTGVWSVLGRASGLFVLAFYATIQHPLVPLLSARTLSPEFARHDRYALFASLVSAWLRVCVWYGVCFFQDNAMHVILENDLTRGSWDWLACIFYTVILLYSACSTATLVRTHLLPCIQLDSQPLRLKFVAGMLALAALYRQRDSQIILIMGWSLAGLSLFVTSAMLSPDALDDARKK